MAANEKNTQNRPATIPMKTLAKSASRTLASLALCLTLAQPALSATFTWDGSDSSDWSTGTNWVGDNPPANDLTSDIALFNSAAYTNQPVAAGVSINGISVGTNSTAALAISGTGLGLGSGGIVKTGSGAVTVSTPLTLGAAQAWTNDNATGLLAVGSTVENGGFLLTIGGTAAGGTTVSGEISGAGGLAKATTTSGTLTLSGANSYSGGTTITGILRAAHNSALGTGTVTVNTGTGNQLQLADGVDVGNALTINGGGVTAQGVLYVPAGNATYSGTINITAAQNSGGHFATVTNTSVLTIAGDNTITSSVPVTIRNGTVVYTGAQNYTGGTSFNTADSRVLLQFAQPASMPASGAVALMSGTSIGVNAGGAGEFTAGTDTGAGSIGGLLAGTGGQGAAVTWPAGSSLGIDTTNATGTVTFANAFTTTNNIGLLKLGTGTLELTNGGTYTGLGAAAAPLVVRRGTLVLNGGTHTSNGELVVGGTFATAAGAAGYDATLQVDAGKLDVNNWFSLGRGNGVGGVSSNLVANNSAVIEADNFSGGYNANNAANLPKGSATLNNTSSLTVVNGGYFHFAESGGSNMTLTLNGSATVTLAGNPGGDNRRNIGFGGTGTININSGTTFTDEATRFLNVGYQNGTGVININGGTFNKSGGELRLGTTSTNGVYTASGTINMSGGTANVGALTLGRGNNNQAMVNGTLHLTGGTFNAGSAGDVILGYSGDHNLGHIIIDGGTFNMSTTTKRWLMLQFYDTASGRIDVNGGNLNLNLNTDIRFSRGNTSAAGTNTINLNGGAITAYTGLATGDGSTAVVDLAQSGAATANNTFNLNGGTLSIGQVITNIDTPQVTFNFNGGLLKATTNSTSFFVLGGATQRANVRDGGAILDTNGRNVTVAEGLLHSNIEGDAAIDGGLVKNGSGTLTLTGTSTYTGPTTVAAGTLALGGTAEINGTSGITVDGSGAKFIQASTTAIVPPLELTHGSLDGTGTIATVNVADSAANTLGAGNGAAGTLTITNLNFFGAATLNLRANGPDMDQSITSEILSTTGTAPIVVNVANSAGFWTSGMTYPLVNFLWYGVMDASHFALGTVPGLNPNQSAELVNTGTSIALLVTGESLVWTGAQSGDWSTTPVGGAQNWSYLSNGIEYSTNSPVIFDDTALRFAVNLAENISPSTVVFTNNANDYTLSSSGGFGLATGSLVLNGAAKVTIATNNTSTGTIVINAGTLEITGDGSVAASSSIANGGSLVFDLADTPNVYANPISGSGSLTKLGAGSLTLAGANTFTGNLTLGAGTLNLDHASALGAAPGVLVINGGTLDNTSGADITLGGAKPQTWNTDVAFTGTHSLFMGGGAVTLGGSGTSRTVNVAANTLGVGSLNGPGYGLVKTGPGMLLINRNAAGTLGGPLDIQQGIVGTSEDLYATGLAGTGILQNSGLTQSKWVYLTGNTDFVFDGIIRNNDGSGTYQIGLLKRGTGTLTLNNNANRVTSNVAVDSGKLVLNGTGTYGNQNNDGTTNTGFTAIVGNTAGANGILEINGPTVNYNNRSNAATDAWRSTLSIGNNGAGAGAVRLHSGSLAVNMQLGMAMASGSFGAYTQTGGTATVGGFVALGLGTGTGLFEMTGGTMTHSSLLTVGAGAGGIGVMRLAGNAVYNATNTSTTALWVAENGTGTLILQDSATMTLDPAGPGLVLGQNAAGAGTLNLLGGTLTTKSLAKGAGTGMLNFNGGKLKANQANAAFLTGLTNAYVHAGGGAVDNGGNAITIGQALLAPSGNRVSATGLVPGGSGFIAPPVVTITGDGTGASAVATIDANGNLTGITMTNPGTGYTTTPAFALVGGGIGSSGGFDGSASLVPATSGGMAFTGAGTTTLTAVNTYTGNTTVGTGSTLVLADNAGLRFAPGANGVSNKITGTGNAFLYGDFTIDLSAAAIANGNHWTLVDVTTRTYDPLTFTVAGFTKVGVGVHQLVDGANTWTFTESTGVLSLAVSAGYGSWAVDNVLDEGTAADDYDGDGVPNGIEYVLGGTKDTNDLDRLAKPGITSIGGVEYFVFTFHRDQASTTPDTTVEIEVGTTLAAWPDVYTVGADTAGSTPGVTVTDNGDGTDTVQLAVPKAPDAAKFARLKVTIAE